ncbi:MAG: hypothetical protein FJ279_31610 [Planctomycetes bacterium]|nr:hypothetical protein [Planctomycetota bacterium]MBM4086995.1 hypothetical protein [Planctomycetota bacterium]
MAIGGERRFRRFVVPNATVEFRREGLSRIWAKSQGEMAPVANIGLGGLQFITTVPLKRGERLTLSLNVQNEVDFIKTRAEVRWAAKIEGKAAYRVGVSFLGYTPEAKKRLMDLERTYWPKQRELEAKSEAEAGVPAPAAAVAAPTPEPQEPEPEVKASARDSAVEDAIPLDEKEAPPEPRVSAPSRLTDAAIPVPEETPEEPSVHLPDSIPVFRLGRDYRIEFSADGLPIGFPVDYIQVPNVDDPDSFACELLDNSMRQDQTPSFEDGNIVVFSPLAELSNRDFALVITNRDEKFRQIIYEPGGKVRLHPLNEKYGEEVLDRRQIKAIWRMVGRYERF